MRLHTLLLGTLSLTAAAAATSSQTKILSPDANGKYWLNTTHLSLAFIPYGASITNLILSDKHGKPLDIVAGYDNATAYTLDKAHPHFGSVPGRYANRIKNSSFTLFSDDSAITYHVTPNENPTPERPEGVDTLHGGPDGWDYRNFTVVAYTNSSITFSIVDPDGKEGFPGQVISYVTYTVSGQTWDIKMVAIATTKKTPIMLSSHTYWNLDGFELEDALNHELWMPFAGMRVGVDGILIPTGELLGNERGGVNDFWSRPKSIGESFGNGTEGTTQKGLEGNCGTDCTGYDNCYLNTLRPSPVSSLSDSWRQPSQMVARLSSPHSGIKLEVYSDQDAFQMYSCNQQKGDVPLKWTQGTDEIRTIPQYGCVVLEVQDWIDGINHPEWGRTKKQVFAPGGDPYVLQARYVFGVDK
ncbi:galactose mutarotase-like domain-containing protein [Pseudoneurospora amorphoporcata]|uniref:Galactose mutarotase-like domain-containing protein n=1 Tax=Pseudoneurospora amorphoporcata TaxID=241081 RepID=A0AAN6SGI2_9PEZI|nr:galactose mutarotase-like domain-containing protein [Pseudoneurospora amorphoporcata]